MKSRMKLLYTETIVKKMMEKFGYNNIHAVPRIEKIVLSMGLNKERNIKENADDLTLIAGQKSYITKSKKSVSQFNVRVGFQNGAMVTLRNNLMYHFLDRVINVALVNWRAFTGLNGRSFNFQKNVTYSFGIPDKQIFSEIRNENMRNEGLNITIVSNCKKVEELRFLMEELGFPFKKI